MKILADQYLYKLDELIPDEAELSRYNPDDGFPEQATEFDALLIRTVTKISRDTLPNAGKLKFIGSATAGFDHVDTGYLRKLGIEFARSEGCNANAVGEFVITVLYKWAQARNCDLSSKTAGVVGCGNTGGRVVRYLKKLGIQTVQYDPPKAERERGFSSAGLEELLTCDILTFHTPLTHSGTHPAFHLCSDRWLEHGFDLIINSARGGVVDEKALLKAWEEGKNNDFILDVWEGEPVFSDEAAGKAFIATPHIAGYSKQAKWKASERVVKEMCRYFGLKPKSSEMNVNSTENFTVQTKNPSFADVLWQNSNVKYYDRELRKMIGQNDKEKAFRFARLRSETETRTEFSSMMRTCKQTGTLPEEMKIFSAMPFTV
jgi:erythronate-4-phosphate dehydrogenase